MKLDDRIAKITIKRECLEDVLKDNDRLALAKKEYKSSAALIRIKNELECKRDDLALQLSAYSSDRVRAQIQVELSDIEERIFAIVSKQKELDEDLIYEWEVSISWVDAYAEGMFDAWRKKQAKAALLAFSVKAFYFAAVCAGTIAGHWVLRQL